MISPPHLDSLFHNKETGTKAGNKSCKRRVHLDSMGTEATVLGALLLSRTFLFLLAIPFGHSQVVSFIIKLWLYFKKLKAKHVRIDTFDTMFPGEVIPVIQNSQVDNG